MPSLTTAQTNAMQELLRIAPVIDDLGRLFRQAGHELYLVGGSVRDALLGQLGHDLDFTTSARPDETHELLKAFTPSTWDIGKEWGTIGALKKADGQEWQIEVTTYRADLYRSDSRKPEVNFGDTLDGDLVRRDFTINAMAINVATRQFVDPYGGLEDLADRMIRTPSTPEISFSDDPLRTMRAARSASAGSFLSRPAMRFSRLGLTTSTTSYPSSASLLATPAPYDPVPSIPTTAQSPGSPIADAISSYPAASALYVPVLRTRPTRSITQRACVSLCVSRPAATVPFSFMRLPSLPQVSGGLRNGQTRH